MKNIKKILMITMIALTTMVVANNCCIENAIAETDDIVYTYEFVEGYDLPGATGERTLDEYAKKIALAGAMTGDSWHMSHHTNLWALESIVGASANQYESMEALSAKVASHTCQIVDDDYYGYAIVKIVGHRENSTAKDIVHYYAYACSFNEDEKEIMMNKFAYAEYVGDYWTKDIPKNGVAPVIHIVAPTTAPTAAPTAVPTAVLTESVKTETKTCDHSHGQHWEYESGYLPCKGGMRNFYCDECHALVRSEYVEPVAHVYSGGISVYYEDDPDNVEIIQPNTCNWCGKVEP